MNITEATEATGPMETDEFGAYLDRLDAATDLCERTWPSTVPTRSDDTYRQHRCGLNSTHRGGCACRYCGKELHS